MRPDRIPKLILVGFGAGVIPFGTAKDWPTPATSMEEVNMKDTADKSWREEKQDVEVIPFIPVPMRFLVVGGSSTLLQIGLLTLFIETGLLQPVFASALSYILSSIYNYFLNYYLTFVNTKSHLETFPKFVLVAATGVGINTLVFAMVFHLSHFYLFAQCIAVTVTLLLNYSLHKYWIYQE